MNESVPVVIPAYEPDRRFLILSDTLKEYPFGPVIVVNDGSGEQYEPLFSEAKARMGKKMILLVHTENRGKGAALKTAFSYVEKNFPDATGVVTADADGQHRAEDIVKVAEHLLWQPDHLILGSRNLTGEEVPWKSRFGNRLTSRIFSFIAGVKIRDTQTGLRGIPMGMFDTFLKIPQDRFEFEMQMLLRCDKEKIREVEIETIYESSGQHTTHFRPIADSIRVYRILLGQLCRYLVSSLSSSGIDLVLFALFSGLLQTVMPGAAIALATVLARICSASYNYLVNKKLVFKSSQRVTVSSVKYAVLAVVQMTLSAGLTTGGAALFPLLPVLVVKICVDVFLFFASYYVQRRFIF